VKTDGHPGGRPPAREPAGALGVPERRAAGDITRLASPGRLRGEAIPLPGEPALPTASARLQAAD
jgi:hypothetical protein